MARSPASFRPPWQPANPKPDADHDERRGSAAARGYDARWRRARDAHLAANPLCVCCLANGTMHPAELVDHIIKHRGDAALFWNRTNWQPLCRWCHDNVKQALEAADAPPHLLNLARCVAGWLHPATR